ncbi:hypothetical protein MLD38_017772 [Melastoma candidum]|uniref:Uncharacterized protein n=1 Tax=Melastoma candidum TaxID=119954 RepID=A0ACB9QV88_9MYRT|nr:hypothetical protein MLD38_017772 [Melastoma candidum]
MAAKLLSGLLLLLMFSSFAVAMAMASGDGIVIQVHSKFKDRRDLSSMRSHDSRRHGRLLSSFDLPLGGNGSPSDTGFGFLLLVYIFSSCTWS